MRFRLKAFGLHLSGSVCVLSAVLGALYLGWYRWPGWYLTGATHVVLVMLLVDATLGPLTTLIIANPRKPRRELTRDIAAIVFVQVLGLAYGTFTLWHGRPLYYAFSVDRLQVVQASDIDASEIALARKQNPRFAPAWYSTPRWVWAPLPDDPQESRRIVSSAIFGGNDVIQMPRYFKPWNEGAEKLRKRLRKVDAMFIFSSKERAVLKRKIASCGVSPGAADAIMLTGRGEPLLAIIDPRTLQVRDILSAD